MKFPIPAREAHTKASPRISPESPAILPEDRQSGCPGTFQGNSFGIFPKASRRVP